MFFREMRPRRPLLGLALAAVAGTALADLFPVPLAAAWASLLAATLWVIVRPSTPACLLLCALTFSTLHLTRVERGEARWLAALAGPAPVVAHAQGVVWSEPQPAKTWSRNYTGSFLLKLERLEFTGAARATTAPVQVRWAGPLPAYGDRLQLLGSLEPMAPPRNEGEFDLAAYRQRQGIYQELRVRYPSDGVVLSSGHGAWSERLAITARHWVTQRLELDLEDEPAVPALIESMVLGLRGETPDDVKELFQRTGTMHLFAVSGLNVAMLASIAWGLLKILRFSRRTALLVLVPLLAGYALLTGLSASCLRACLMGGLLLAAYPFDRQFVSWNAIAAAALAILAWDTNQLFLPGFQFSFALVLALLWLAEPLQARLTPLGQPDPFLPAGLWSRRQRWQALIMRSVLSMAGVSFVAWLGSFAFTAGYFHLIAPSTVAANLLAVPLAFGILLLGVCTLLGSLVSSALAICFNNANWLCVQALLVVVRFFGHLPGGSFYVGPPSALLRASEVELSVLDVGAGGATYLHSFHSSWLIDCAHGYEYERIVLPFLRARGVNRLDGLVLTHGDAQHIGGAAALLDDCAPRLILDSTLKDRSSTRRTFAHTLAERNLPKRLVQRGDSVTLEPGLRLSVLYPPAGLIRSSADDKALVLRVETAGGRALLMSDSGFATEQWLLEHEPDLRADVVIKGEHAKDAFSDLDFLLRVAPCVVIASAATQANSEPRAQWAESVRARGITLFLQEECGQAKVRLSAGRLEVRGFANGQVFSRRAL